MRKLALVGVSGLLALSASACSLVGGRQSDDPPSASTSVPGTSAPSDPPTAQPSASDLPSAAPTAPIDPTPADPNQPGAGGALGKAVTTRTSSFNGTKIAMTVYPIRRDGTTSHVNLGFSSPGSTSLGSMLSDNNTDASDARGTSADGLQIVDGKNSKVYLVASDGAGHCLCSQDLRFAFLRDNAPVLVSATFAAPPADVTSVDLRIPSFGTVSDVPVQ